MTVRYQFALNSENPEVVRAGLTELIAQIYHDYPIVHWVRSSKNCSFQELQEKFQCLRNGRFEEGVVHEFGLASPQFQEFFTIWTLHQGMEDPELSAAHMHCLGLFALLRRDLASRILKNYSQQIIDQLLSKNEKICSQTLFLVFSCVLVKAPLNEPIFEFLLDHFLFDPKTLKKWSLLSSNPDEENTTVLNPNILSLLLMIEIIAGEPLQSSLILSKTNILEKLFQSLDTYREGDVLLFLDIIMFLMKKFSKFALHLPFIFQKSSLRKLFTYQVAKANQALDFAVHDFLITTIDTLLHPRFFSGKSKSVFEEFFGVLIDSLNPTVLVDHRKVELKLMDISISLKVKPFKRLKMIPWDNLSAVPAEHLQHLVDLLQVIPPSSNFSENEQSRLNLMITAGLSRSSLSKLLSSDNIVIKSSALDIFRIVFEEISSSEISSVRIFDILPDLSFVPSCWQRINDEMETKLRHKNVATEEKKLDSNISELESDLDILVNFDGIQADTLPVVPEESSQSENSDTIIQFRRYLTSFLTYISVVINSSVANVLLMKFDLLKAVEIIVDMYVHDPNSCFHLVELSHLELLFDTIAITTSVSLVKWFGQIEEINKIFNMCIVTPDWISGSTKSISQFSRFISCCVKLSQAQSMMCIWKATNIITDLLLNVERLVFPLVSFDNQNEIRLFANFLLESVKTDHRSIFVFDIFLRLAVHYQVPILLYVQQFAKAYSHTTLFLTGLFLFAGDLTPFLKGLPSHIVKNFSIAVSDSADVKSSAFFEKFRKGFMNDFIHLFNMALIPTVFFSGDPKSRLNNMESIFKRLKGINNQSPSGEDVFELLKTVLWNPHTQLSFSIEQHPIFNADDALIQLHFSRVYFGYIKFFETNLSSSYVSSLKDCWKSIFQDITAQFEYLKDKMNCKNCFQSSSTEIIMALKYLYKCNDLLTIESLPKLLSNALLQLSDLLCVELLGFVSKFSNCKELSLSVPDILQFPLVKDHFLAETPFGMICRRLICSLLSIGSLNCNMYDVIQFYLSKLFEFVMTHVTINYVRDASYPLIVECILESILVANWESRSLFSTPEFTKLILVYFSWILQFDNFHIGDRNFSKSLNLEFLLLKILPRMDIQKSFYKRLVSILSTPSVSFNADITDAILPRLCSPSKIFSAFNYYEPLLLFLSDSDNLLKDLTAFKIVQNAPNSLAPLVSKMMSKVQQNLITQSFFHRLLIHSSSMNSLDQKIALTSDAQSMMETMFEKISAIIFKADSDVLLKTCLDFVNSRDKRMAFVAIISSIDNFSILELCFSSVLNSSIYSLTPEYSDLENQQYLFLRVLQIFKGFRDRYEINQKLIVLLTAWTKQILKHHIQNPQYLKLLIYFLQIFYDTSCAKDLLGYDKLIFFHPGNLIHLISTHSKFKNIIGQESAAKSTTSIIENLELLSFLLSILHTLKDGTGFSMRMQLNSLHFGASTQVFEHLQKIALSRYSGTVSEVDRLLFNMFYLLQGPLSRSNPTIARRLPNIIFYKILSTERPMSEAVIDFFKQNIVHDTLNSFPFRRTLAPTGLYWETLLSDKLTDFYTTEFFLSTNICGPDKSRDDSYSIVYDPAFVIPLLHLCIEDLHSRFVSAMKIIDEDERSFQSSSIKIRPFVNCGGLALILAGLASDCISIRTLSWNGLQKFSVLVNSPVAEGDNSFTDRSNIVMLLSFLKNGIIIEENGVPLLPSVITTFMAKASMILLLKQHSLYPEIGTYLLSKPYADFYDVPLFDQIVFSSLGTNESIAVKSITEDFSKISRENIKYQKLQVLRLLRDSVKRFQDFTILARKNIFSRMFLFYEDWADNDQRFGKIVIEIIETCLGVSVAAFEYLIVKGEIFVWLFERFSSLFSRNFSVACDRNWIASFSQIMGLLRKIINSFYLHFLSNTSGNINSKFYSNGFYQIQLFIKVLLKFLCSQKKAEFLPVMEMTLPILFDNLFIFQKILSDIELRNPEYENDFYQEIHIFPQIKFIFQIFNQYLSCKDSITETENAQFKKLLMSSFLIFSNLLHLSQTRLTPHTVRFIFENYPEKLIIFFLHELRSMIHLPERAYNLRTTMLSFPEQECFMYSLGGLEIQSLTPYNHKLQYCNISFFRQSKEWSSFFKRENSNLRFEVIWTLHQKLEYESTANTFPETLQCSFLYRSLVQFILFLSLNSYDYQLKGDFLSDQEDIYFILASYFLYFYRLNSPLFYDFSFDLSNQNLRFPDSFNSIDPLQEISVPDVWNSVVSLADNPSMYEPKAVKFCLFLVHMVQKLIQRIVRDYSFVPSSKILTFFNEVILLLQTDAMNILEKSEFLCSRMMMEIISVVLASFERLNVLNLPENQQSIREERDILQSFLETSLLSVISILSSDSSSQSNKRKRKDVENDVKRTKHSA